MGKQESFKSHNNWYVTYSYGLHMALVCTTGSQELMSISYWSQLNLATAEKDRIFGIVYVNQGECIDCRLVAL